MKILEPSSYRVMAWKNGGGVTTELHVDPADGDFQWRVSIADVAGDGPFSRFDGYDRHIMLIEGNGMMLEGGPAGPIDVTELYEPQQFSGDWDVAGRLIDGPVRDLNLMSRRADCRSSLRCARIDRESSFESSGGTVLLYVLEGVLRCAGRIMPVAHGMLLLAGETSLVVAADRPVLVAVCEIQPSLSRSAIFDNSLSRSTSSGGAATLLATEKAS